MAGKAHPVGGKHVEMRCFHDTMPSTRQGIGPKLIESDEQDIWAFHYRLK
jgi:hypothetical protein